jgi:hypothetical protein
VHRVHAHGHIEQQQVVCLAGPLQTLDHIWSTFSAAAEARPSLAEASPNRIAGALLGQTPPRGGVAQLLRGHSCVLLQSLLSSVMAETDANSLCSGHTVCGAINMLLSRLC